MGRIAQAVSEKWPSFANTMTEEEAKARLEAMHLQPWQIQLAQGIARSIGPSIGVRF